MGRLRFAMCSFGAAWRKDTDLHLAHAAFLAPLALPCAGGHGHVRLQGRMTTAAARYPPELCRQWAELVAAARRAEAFPPQAPPTDPRAIESPWFNGLLRALPFRTVRQTRWRRRRHINLLEVCMVRQAAEHGLRRYGTDIRVPVGVDSLVGCGVCNKGRSASQALNAEWRKGLGLEVCCGVRLGLHFAPTRLNPGDAPSRHREVPPPSAQPPPWLNASGIDWDQSDRWAEARCRREHSSWATLVLLLLGAPAGRGHRKGKGRRGSLAAFDPSGLEGDGPPRTRSPRPVVDLRTVEAVRPQTSRRRRMLLGRLHAWLLGRFSVPLSALWCADVGLADRVLEEYGQCMYEAGASLHDFSETINALVAGRREWRRATPYAWALARNWRLLFPVQSHRPVPAVVLLAMQAVALELGWLLFAMALGVGFFGLLRPGELVRIRVGDLRLPSQLLGPRGRMFVELGIAKTSFRGGLLHQHVRLDDLLFVDFVEAVLGRLRLPPDTRLLMEGPHAFRQRWDFILSHLGIPTGVSAGLTPAGLRAGGASHLFENTQDLALVRWRGRWASDRTLETYLQELEAASIVPRLSGEARARVHRWAAVAGPLVVQLTAAFGGH